MKLCIGLFGTCGGSQWRNKFIERYKQEGIEFFNPQVDDWTPDMAAKEARHLAEDDVILFPVTSETYATGSLAESGFSIANALRLDDRRDFVFMVETSLDDSLDNEDMRKESLRGRSLVLEHFKRLNLPNVYLVESLEDMLEVSIQLYRAAEIREPLRRFNPSNLTEKE